MSRQRATVERDAGPSDALHVRHVGVVIQVRVMLGLFLDNAEDAGGRLASLLPTRHPRPQGPAFGIIYSDPLVAQRNDGHDRLHGPAGGPRLGRYPAFLPTVFFAPTFPPPNPPR